MDKKIFREKSLERVESPEQLNDYIQVASPGVWLSLAACLLILLGLLVWSMFGTVEERADDGTVRTVHPITYVMN